MRHAKTIIGKFFSRLGEMLGDMPTLYVDFSEVPSGGVTDVRRMHVTPRIGRPNHEGLPSSWGDDQTLKKLEKRIESIPEVVSWKVDDNGVGILDFRQKRPGLFLVSVFSAIESITSWRHSFNVEPNFGSLLN